MQRPIPELTLIFMINILTVYWMPPCTSCFEDRSAQELSEVPKNLSENVVTLDLSINNITTINRHDFSKLKQVKTINLSYNKIQILQEDSFEDVVCLVELNLSYNNIVHLPLNIFRSNQNLTQLYLKKNRLQFMGDSSKAEHLLDSESLTYLDVSFCNITYISSEALCGLPNLEKLIINGNPLTQESFEIMKSPRKLKEIRIVSGNDSTLQKLWCNWQEQNVETTACTSCFEDLSARGLSEVPKNRPENLSILALSNNNSWQEQNVEITSLTFSHPTSETGTNEDDEVDPVVVKVGIIMCFGVFVIIVTSYFLITRCKSRRANEVTIEEHNSLKAIAIQQRPLPSPPLQDNGYEVPNISRNECISSVSSHNLQLERNRGYTRVPLVENDGISRTVPTTDHVLTETNHGSKHSLSCSTEYQDNVPYSSNTYIYSCSEINEEEENNLPVPCTKEGSSVPTTPQFARQNRPSCTYTTSTAIPLPPFQKLGSPLHHAHFKKQNMPLTPASKRLSSTSQVSSIKNVTTFGVKKINSKNVYVSSTFIELGQHS